MRQDFERNDRIQNDDNDRYGTDFDRNWDRNDRRNANGYDPRNGRGDDWPHDNWQSPDQRAYGTYDNRYPTGRQMRNYNDQYDRGWSRNGRDWGNQNREWANRPSEAVGPERRYDEAAGREGWENREMGGWRDQAGYGGNRDYQREFGQSSYFGGVRHGDWGREAMKRSDEDIEDGIHDAFDDERGIPHDIEIDVKVEDHVVTLTGNAPNRYIKELAGRWAWNEPGVRDVHNNLTIMPSRRERAARNRMGSNQPTTTMGADNTPASAATNGQTAAPDLEESRPRDRADVR